MVAHEFTEFLSQVRFGQLGDELTEALQDMVAACNDTGKAGSITLTLKFSPGKSGQIEIDDKVVSKEPKHPVPSTIMFSTPDNFLQREDPRQTTMDLKVVERQTEEPRRVS